MKNPRLLQHAKALRKTMTRRRAGRCGTTCAGTGFRAKNSSGKNPSVRSSSTSSIWNAVWSSKSTADNMPTTPMTTAAAMPGWPRMATGYWDSGTTRCCRNCRPFWSG